MNKSLLVQNFLFEEGFSPVALLNEEGIIINANQSYADFYGFNKEELIGKSFLIHFSYLSKAEQEFILKDYKVNCKTNNVVSKFLKVRDKNNNEKKIHTKHKFVFSTLESYSIILINEFESLDESKMQSLLEYKNDFLNSVAHDIRSPISAIKSLIDIFKTNTQTDESMHLLDLISISLNHVLDIGNNLLEIAKIEDTNEILFQDVELNKFIKSIIQKFHPISFKKKITLIFHPYVYEFYHPIQKDRIEIAISNLISNAIKFSSEESDVEIYLKMENDSPTIIIKDSGIGISDIDKEVLFEKFSSAKRQGTHGEKSTGLGLFIVKEIIDKHGGSINVESGPEKGSIFSIRL